MAKKRTVLGRGLNALLGDHASHVPQGETPTSTASRSNKVDLHEYLLDHIEANPFQPRKYFNREALDELASSIKIYGVIQPIVLKKVAEHRYQLIAGERRYHASKLAGLTSIPAYVRDATSQEMLEMALIENIQREDLNPIELALSYQRLITDTKVKQEELAHRVSKDRSTVANYLRLLKLPPSIQAALRDHQLTMGHARALIGIKNADHQLYLSKRIVSEGLSVRKIEELTRQLERSMSSSTSDGKSTSSSRPVSETLYHAKEIITLQTKLSSHFGSRIKIVLQGKKGEIKIPFLSVSDLNRIIDILKI